MCDLDDSYSQYWTNSIIVTLEQFKPFTVHELSGEETLKPC